MNSCNVVMLDHTELLDVSMTAPLAQNPGGAVPWHLGPKLQGEHFQDEKCRMLIDRAGNCSACSWDFIGKASKNAWNFPAHPE